MSGHLGQHRGWREAMQTGAANLLNIDLQPDGMHDIAPCSSFCCKPSRNDHAMRSHERSQWDELRSLGLRLVLQGICLKTATCVTLSFSIFFQRASPRLCEDSHPSSACFECVLTVLASKAGFLPKTPQVFLCWTPSL